LAACEENLTIGCTATGFPPLRSAKPAREPGVIAYEDTTHIFRLPAHFYWRKHLPIFQRAATKS